LEDSNDATSFVSIGLSIGLARILRLEARQIYGVDSKINIEMNIKSFILRRGGKIEKLC